MANVTFAPEAAGPPPLDARLEELAASAAALGKGIRIRIQPDIYDYEKQNNQAWTGLIWTLEVEDVEEGRRLREGLTLFMRKFGAGAESQEKLLAMLKNGKAKKRMPVLSDEDAANRRPGADAEDEANSK